MLIRVGWHTFDELGGISLGEGEAMEGTLGWVLDRAARTNGDGLAVVDGEARLSYGELADHVRRLGSGLLGLGLSAGDVVGVLSLNSTAHLECWLGIPAVGLVLNDLNYRLTVEELAFIVEDCDTTTMVVDDVHLDIGIALRERCPRLRHLVHVGDKPTPEGVVPYAELLAAEPTPVPDLQADTLAAIFYTGGTTGRSKGVMLSHANLMANAKHMLIASGHRRQDRYLHAGPMFHLADGSQTYALTWVGGTHVIVPAFEPELVIRTMQTERVTTVLLVPTMINLVVNHAAISEADLSSLRLIIYGASPMPAELQRRAMAALPCDWVQAYGMTEAAPLVSATDPEDARRGVAGEEPFATRLSSAGPPVVGVQAEVRRPDGSQAEIGEAGEIWVRGPNVMAGYWKRPEETAEVLVDGWYRTGDVAHADAEGYLYVVDRAKDMIISGGENVYTTEVENALYQHPAVLEAAVFGVPDERWGERVHATVVLRPEAKVTERELVEHCRALIAGYKVPRGVDLSSEPLPKSGAGKILKRELRAPHWADHDRQVH